MSDLRVIIDFDSTLVRVESLDELARIALKDVPKRDKRLAQIEHITREGMAGRIPFGESLSQRLALFSATKEHLVALDELLSEHITASFRDEITSLREVTHDIFVVSGGFKEFIVPIVAQFGIDDDHVMANTFTYDAAGLINGCDMSNPLASDGGKALVVEKLSLPGTVVMVGDGFSDLQVAKSGHAHKFIAYIQHVNREEVSSQADAVAEDFGEVTAHLVQFDGYAGVA
jgi:D-3-phosphoglycerate dehydrogenase